MRHFRGQCPIGCCVRLTIRPTLTEKWALNNKLKFYRNICVNLKSEEKKSIENNKSVCKYEPTMFAQHPKL